MQDPERYESSNSVAQEIVEVYVPKLIDTMEWSPGDIVLDYGCGAGRAGYNYILPKVEELNSKLYSVDVSDKMIAYAKKHYTHERIEYGVGDIFEKFPFPNVKFDKIFAVNVLPYIRDIR